MLMKYLILCPLLLSVFCAPSSHKTAVDGPLVRSWSLVDVEPLNSGIDDAVAAGEEWPRSALLATLELFGGEADTRILELTVQGNRGEAPDTMIVIMTREGFLDDSVRGDWHKATLYRKADSTWRLHEVRRAFRCWRGGSVDSYEADWCP